MKKLIFLLVLLLSFPVMGMCQAIDISVDGQPLSEYFLTLGGVATLGVFFTGRLKALFKTDGFWNQILAWFVSFAVMVPGILLKWGIFASGFVWYEFIFYGLVIGLISNGIFDMGKIPIILNLWNFIKSLFGNKST